MEREPDENGAEDADLTFWDWSGDPPGADGGDYDAEPGPEAEAGPEAAASGPEPPAAGQAAGPGDADPASRPGGPVPGLGPAYQAGRAQGDSIGSRLGRLDHIWGHSRAAIWQQRLIISVVLGAIVALLAGWPLGVTVAVLAAIADTVIRSRVASAPPVPSARKPTRPQRMTQRQLAQLEKAGYRAIHYRLIPDSEEHIDHLVIGPAGVFAIDSEWWDKSLPIRTKNARQLWLGPFSMKERLEHARWEADQASSQLTRAAGHQVQVRPAMVVYGPKIPWDVANIRDVDVFSGKRLRSYLRRFPRRHSARPLAGAEIDRIYQAGHRAFPLLDPGVPAPPLP